MVALRVFSKYGPIRGRLLGKIDPCKGTFLFKIVWLRERFQATVLAYVQLLYPSGIHTNIRHVFVTVSVSSAFFPFLLF